MGSKSVSRVRHAASNTEDGLPVVKQDKQHGEQFYCLACGQSGDFNGISGQRAQKTRNMPGAFLASVNEFRSS